MSLPRILSLWLWLLAPLALIAIHSAYGAPHVIWSYRVIDNGRPYDPLAPRRYTECSYVGWWGDVVTVPASGGACPWVRFFQGERS